MEDLRKIRPVMAFIVEHHTEVFQDLKPLPQPSKVNTGNGIIANNNLVNVTGGSGLGAQGQGLVAMGGLEGGGSSQLAPGLGTRGSTLPSSLTVSGSGALDASAGTIIPPHPPTYHIPLYALVVHTSHPSPTLSPSPYPPHTSGNGDQTAGGGSGPRVKPNLPRLQTTHSTAGTGDPPRPS